MNTLPQIKQLLISAFEKKSPSKQDALELVEYYVRRNYTAYKSHRKRRLKILEELGVI